MKKLRTCVKNLTQPIFVKKSYLYLGIQPLITIKNIKLKVILIEIIIVKSEQ